MAVLPIIETPDPRLKVVSEPVAVVDDGMRALIDDMFDSMYAAKGIGLAAVQIGVARRVLVIDLQREDVREPRVFINPEIIWESEEFSIYNEGCLSVPEQYADVERPAAVKVKYLDASGKFCEEELGGLLATCLQHEMDHLDGVLFIDHLSRLKRDMLLRKLAKMRREAVPA